MGSSHVSLEHIHGAKNELCLHAIVNRVAITVLIKIDCALSDFIAFEIRARRVVIFSVGGEPRETGGRRRCWSVDAVACLVR